jgi:hypothetical protein
MTLKDITEKVKLELKQLTGFEPESVISAKQEPASLGGKQGGSNEWLVVVEMLEKAGIPDRMDIIGVYSARLDTKGNLLSYERIGLRKRGDTAGQEVEETE